MDEKPEPPCKTGSQCITKCMECAEPTPVAVVSGYYGGKCVVLPTDPARIFNSGTAFYTHPPKRKPLTDEEVQMVPKEKDMGVAEVKDAMSRLDKELDVYRNEVLEEVAVVIEQFKGSFGQDTVMSFAALVRGMKR